MRDVRRTYLNDNIRTEHLKCAACRTRVYLVAIERDPTGAEVRSFACPHCQQRRTLRLEISQAAPSDALRAGEVGR